MYKIAFLILFSCASVFARNQNSVIEKTALDSIKKIKPMVADVGMADPHIHIFNNKAYLYATRDGDISAKKFVMPDWKIWTSSDLINWKLESTIDPATTYMGKSDNCWAPDMAFKNNKYYFYFSNGNKNTGVLVGDKPAGPFKDVLGKPFLAEDLTPIAEYDPTVLIDDDAAKTAYIAFGHFRANDPAYYYMIAKLGEDMISLTEAPKKIEITGNAEGLGGNDKPTLHKRNGIFYLSAGTAYATSNNIYGPYVRKGFSANRDEYGLNNAAHGNYFEWNNQWFHTWCHFYLGKDVARYRQSYVNYLHYKDNGEMVDDTDFLDKHGEIGVGQYDANWNKIEAEWYMAADKTAKMENPKGGFSIQNIQNGGSLFFPNIKNIKKNSSLTFRAATLNSGTIEVRQGSTKGNLVASCKITSTGAWDNYKDFSCKISSISENQNLYLVFKGSGNNLFNLDYFKFNQN